MNSARILYVGMDVDKEKIAMAVLEQTGSDFVGARIVRNTPDAIRKYFKELKKNGTEIQACYSMDQETLDEYYARVVELEEHCQRMAVRVEEIADEERYAEPVRQLKAFKGICTLIALSLIVENRGFPPLRYGRAVDGIPLTFVTLDSDFERYTSEGLLVHLVR